MSASLSPRPLAGLAAAALVVGLIGAPLVAFAEPTPTPTSTASATSLTAAPPSATPTETSTPSSGPESTEPESQEPSPTESSSAPAASKSTPNEGTPSVDAGSNAVAGSRNGDALAAPGTTQEQLAAQAEGQEPITLSKRAFVDGKPANDNPVSKIGQIVTYRFVARSATQENGGLELANVKITDELEGLSTLTCDRDEPVTLQPGEELSCSANLRVTQAVLDFGDVYNFASVFGDIAGDSGNYVGANASARVIVDQSPSIVLKASVSPTGTADRGDRLRYRATATNTGNVTLTRARITSSLDSLDLDCEPSARATLAPGASISCAGSYRVSTADARRGRVTNELTARAEPPYGATDSSSDDITDDVKLRNKVTKVADDSGLADTGGPALPIGLAGLAAAAAGFGLIRRARRV